MEKPSERIKRNGAFAGMVERRMGVKVGDVNKMLVAFLGCGG